MVYTPATYEFFIRNPRTYAFVGEVVPADIQQVEWTRVDVVGGSWKLVIPREKIDIGLTAAHNLFEVRRNGVQEFVGVLERREIDPLGKIWTLSGPDLCTWWLNSRMVGAATADDRTGIAEAVLVDYVNAHLATPSDAARRASNYTPGKTWAVEASSGRGLTVDISARRRPLSQVVEDVCRSGEIVLNFRLLDDYSGCLLGVANPFTPVSPPFSVAWENVEELVFTEDYQEYKNHIWVMGNGSGDSRPYTEVEDADSVTTDFRREWVSDARYAADESARTQIGQLELANRNRRLVSVRAKPFRASANAEYRTDWDVGWDIEFAEPALRADPVTTRVVAATIRLNRERGEDISFELGERRANSVVRKLTEAVMLSRIASNE